ncbi:hypothetical protein IKG24_00755 [Candidatus Saccharibacteria bacterium]|nr:hypothetical protein [Candidatus Saccharibacteria bacterium]
MVIPNDNFDLTKANHAKQAAYGEMVKVQEKMDALSSSINDQTAEINERQLEFNELKKQQQAEWEKYNTAQLALKEEIGGKITAIKECDALEENFRLMSENADEDRNKAEIYASGANFFARLASEKMIERDQLISKKRSMIRPDTDRSARLLEHLKSLRSERNELLNDYHALKNEFSLKKANFDRMKSKYDAIKNGTEENSYDFRPIILDNLTNKRLLVDAGIPSEYHETCKIEQRSDGKIDIYYGGSLEMKHGHIIMENGKNIFSRDPKPKNTAV